MFCPLDHKKELSIGCYSDYLRRRAGLRAFLDLVGWASLPGDKKCSGRYTGRDKCTGCLPSMEEYMDIICRIHMKKKVCETLDKAAPHA